MLDVKLEKLYRLTFVCHVSTVVLVGNLPILVGEKSLTLNIACSRDEK